MLIVMKEKKLPGVPLAARASLLWVENYLVRTANLGLNTTEVIVIM